MNYFIRQAARLPDTRHVRQPHPWRHERARSTTGSSPTFSNCPTPHGACSPTPQDLGDDGPPFRWDPERRALLRADLDAGFLHVYGLDRDEAEHVLDSFPVVRKYDERDFGEYRTKRLVLEAYDRMAEAIANGGKGWKPLADPPAGHGPRHSE